MTIDLFIPCSMDQFYPKTAVNTMKVLQRAGVDVAYDPEQTCCGRFAYNAGYTEEAKSLGDKFLSVFCNDRPVVSPSASCVAYIKKCFPILFKNTSNHLEYQRLERNIFELTDFLVNVMHYDDFAAEFPHKVTYQDSCNSLRGLGLGNEARQLLSRVKGLELIEMKQQEMCCGGEFTFAMNHEEVSLGMANHKIRNAMNTGAEYIVTSDMSCFMHQKSYIDAQGLPIQIIHIADILASTL